jgi:hypothetical protein
MPSTTVTKNRFDSHECVICGDPIRAANSFHAPCTHRYCRGCIVDLVESATRDEALFPLRCCHQSFELADIRPFLTSHLFRRMSDKALEFGTPSSNRVYCTSATCSAFLGPASGGRMNIVCPQCQTIVCSACKNVAHANDPYRKCGYARGPSARSSVAMANLSQLPGRHRAESRLLPHYLQVPYELLLFVCSPLENL